MKIKRPHKNIYSSNYYNKIKSSQIDSFGSQRNYYEQENKEPKGLVNESLNCYINSLLQCFYYIPELRNYFINNKNYFSDNQPVCMALSDIMYKLKYGNEKYYKVTKFIKIMEKNNRLFSSYKGGDAKDLFFNLIDLLLNEMIIDYNDNKSTISLINDDKKKMLKEAKKEIGPNNIINSLFIGFYEIIYKCQKANPYLKKEVYAFNTEAFILFELEIISNYYKNDIFTLEDCFDYNFNRRYNTSFYCSLCDKKETNISEEKIYEPPKILVLILDRGKGKKFKGNVDINTYLNLKSFIDQDNDKEFNFNYKLISILTHSGPSSSSGHYTACCLTDKGKFYHFNDEYVQEITNKKQLFKDEPYLLFYKREEDSLIE